MTPKLKLFERIFLEEWWSARVPLYDMHHSLAEIKRKRW